MNDLGMSLLDQLNDQQRTELCAYDTVLRILTGHHPLQALIRAHNGLNGKTVKINDALQHKVSMTTPIEHKHDKKLNTKEALVFTWKKKEKVFEGIEIE